MTETDLQNKIRLKLSGLGFAVFRANVGTLRTKDGRYITTGLPKGFSDLFAVKDGRAYFIEVKLKPNTPTHEQERFLLRMRQNGCVAGVVYSVDEAVEMVKETI